MISHKLKRERVELRRVIFAERRGYCTLSLAPATALLNARGGR